uniref:SAV_915 family protein n=1 Tax=Streptomyces sp. NEAU-174 TaxID=3458254 RepID=UPI0040440912
PGPAGCAVRLFRTPHGSRTAVGFSTRRRLAAVLGARQPWIRLGESALRALAEPLGATSLTVDPRLAVRDIAPPASELRHAATPAVAPPAPPHRRDATLGGAFGAVPVAGAATPVGLLSPSLG